MPFPCSGNPLARSALTFLPFAQGPSVLPTRTEGLGKKDQVSPFRVAALIWPEHDVVSSWVAETCSILQLWTHFHISTAAFDILLVLCLILDDEITPIIAEGIETSRYTEELGILACLDARVLCLIDMP